MIFTVAAVVTEVAKEVVTEVDVDVEILAAMLDSEVDKPSVVVVKSVLVVAEELIVVGPANVHLNYKNATSNNIFGFSKLQPF